MPHENFMLLFMGHSIVDALKVGEDADFDAYSITGSRHKKNYTTMVASYFKTMLVRMMAIDFMAVCDCVCDLSQAELLETIASLLAIEQEDLFYLLEQRNVGKEKLSLAATQAHFAQTSNEIRHHVIAHSGKRAQAYASSAENDQNAAEDYTRALRDLTVLPNLVITHLGENDMRLDHCQTPAIFEGLQFITQLKGNEPLQETTEQMKAQTYEYLQTKNYSQAAISLFLHRVGNGTDIHLLRMSLQIYNINIRLGHNKAYYHIGNEILAQLESFMETFDNSEVSRKIETTKAQYQEKMKDIIVKTSIDEKIKVLKELFQTSELQQLDNEQTKLLFGDWQKLRALNFKNPQNPNEKNATELFAQGEIEKALEKLAEQGLENAEMLKNDINEARINLFDAMSEITQWYAPICRMLPTKYCHLVSPPFHNAYGLFNADINDDSIYDFGSAIQEELWTEIANIFPNTYEFSLASFTEIFELGKHPHADGAHWTESNYADVSLPIALALLAIMHGVQQEDLLPLVVAANVADKSVNPVDVLLRFTQQLQNSGHVIAADFDVIFDCVKASLEQLGQPFKTACAVASADCLNDLIVNKESEASDETDANLERTAASQRVLKYLSLFKKPVNEAACLSERTITVTVRSSL